MGKQQMKKNGKEKAQAKIQKEKEQYMQHFCILVSALGMGSAWVQLYPKVFS